MKRAIKLISLISIAVSVVVIVIYTYDSVKNDAVNKKIRDIYVNETVVAQSFVPETTSPLEIPVDTAEYVKETELPESPEEKALFFSDLKKNPNSKLLGINDDFTGWLRVGGTSVDYPVVKHSDNSFYLDKDFYKEENTAGSIYMDYRNFGNELDGNIIIYGHNMKNGTMFNSLNNYKEEEFFLKNTTITFSNLYRTYEYEIFSAYWVSADDYKLEIDFRNTDINEYYEYLKDRSLFRRDIENADISQIITLATCSYEVDNGRLMVHGILKNQ